MSKSQTTQQENFWKGKFGSDYIKRHETKKWVTNNKYFFLKCLKNLNKSKVKTLIEFGSNIGLNLMALNKIKKFKQISAVEINHEAHAQLSRLKYVNPINKSVLDYSPKKKYDLVLCKGFLIHINPNKLNRIYKKIYDSCKKNGHILICEYYSQNPISINYRGNKNVLFKRDFAGEILDKYSKTLLIDYGFVYRKDKFPQDDMNWFLIKKI
ncbi:MAG: pseudaminic acid biosynthesis-associated methylase [Rickettsiales bacterium]|nr:pseudaminic acid biosynthesis-associated methylase [Rickettsiales bacterium]|tara:strand:+ start:1224 stop:1856 length:633 start_codon:yes stop_codon:yes gene_type:complete